MEREIKYVRWQTFIWAMGIVTVIMGYIINTQIQLASDQNSERVEFAKIQTQLVNIEKELIEVKIAVEKHVDK